MGRFGMGTIIDCFLLEPSNYAELAYRRFTYSSETQCAKAWGHDAVVVLERVDYPLENNLHGESLLPTNHLDPRWPSVCSVCGYAFLEGDQWQVNRSRLFTRSDTSELVTLMGAPPGAMWYADWLYDEYRNAQDGHTLVVKTPGGDWIVDGTSKNNGPGWTRTGVPPMVTASPSIVCGSYHGWLKDGKLQEC
jgi:hypothetical protein